MGQEWYRYCVAWNVVFVFVCLMCDVSTIIVVVEVIVAVVIIVVGSKKQQISGVIVSYV
jgi:hypothetical protein